MKTKLYLSHISLILVFCLGLMSAQAQNTERRFKTPRLHSTKVSENEKLSKTNATKARPEFYSSSYPIASIMYTDMGDGWELLGSDSLGFNDFGSLIYYYNINEGTREYSKYNEQNNPIEVLTTKNGVATTKRLYIYDPIRKDFITHKIDQMFINGTWVESYHHFKDVIRDQDNKVTGIKIYTISEGDTSLHSQHSMTYGADGRATHFVTINNFDGAHDTTNVYADMTWAAWEGSLIESDFTDVNKLASATVIQYHTDGKAIALLNASYSETGFVWNYTQPGYLGTEKVEILDDKGSYVQTILDLEMTATDTFYTFGERESGIFDSHGNELRIIGEVIEDPASAAKTIAEPVFHVLLKLEFANNYDNEGRLLDREISDYQEGIMIPIEKIEYSYAIDDNNKKILENRKLSVFPNPATDFVTIDLEGNYSALQVCDLSGRVLKTFAYKPNGSYSIADLAEGYYILKIVGTDATATAKIYKTK